MASGKDGNGTIFSRLGLKPMTKCNLAKFYIPTVGAASYATLSVTVINPELAVRILPKQDITNILLGGALIGTTSYIYTRDHIKAATPGCRIAYSACGAILVSFGSVLLWALLRSVIPPNSVLCTVAGIGSGLAILKVGSDYLAFVDSQVVKK